MIGGIARESIFRTGGSRPSYCRSEWPSAPPIVVLEQGMTIAPLFIGCVALLATGRALILGAASADGAGITRKNEPIFFWAFVVAGLVAAAFLFYLGLRR